MRPPGPVPFKLATLTPFSRANRLAAALMLGSRSRAVWILPSEAYSVGSGAEVGAGADAAVDSSDFFSSLAAGTAALPPASDRLKDSKAEMSVPSSTRTAIGLEYS